MRISRVLYLSLIGVMCSTGYAFADNPTSGSCGDDCTWELVGTTLKFSGSGAMDNYDRSDSTTTAPWAPYYNTVTKVEIGSDLTSIGDKAFRGFSSLTTVDFGTNSSIQTIGDRAFSTAGLTSITIPSSVTELKEGALGWNSNLSQVNFEANSQLQTIGTSAFYDSTSLQSIDIPSTVKTIGSSAFTGSTSLESVNFGENSQLQSIGEYAFFGIAKLGTTSDPDTLGSFTIPASVQTIGRNAFDGANFDTLIFEEGSQLSYIGVQAFMGKVGTIIGLDEIAALLLSGNFDNFATEYNRPVRADGHHTYTASLDPNFRGSFYCQDVSICQQYIQYLVDHGWSNGRTPYEYSYDPNKGYIVGGKYYKTVADLMSGNSYVPKMPKRIYTVEEAVDALGSRGKNTFSIKYR